MINMDELISVDNEYCLYCNKYNFLGLTHDYCYKFCFIKRHFDVYRYSSDIKKILRKGNKKEINKLVNQIALSASLFINSLNLNNPIIIPLPEHITNSIFNESLVQKISKLISTSLKLKIENSVIQKVKNVGNDYISPNYERITLVKDIFQVDKLHKLRGKDIIMINGNSFQKNLLFDATNILYQNNTNVTIWTINIFGKQKASL